MADPDPKPTLTEVWKLPLVELPVFLDAIGIPVSSYYGQRKVGAAFPVIHFGRKPFVRPAEAAAWFAALPADISRD